MIFRFSLGLLFATLAFAAAMPLHAAPAASAPVDSVTYHIERYNQQITVKDADEETLATCTTATPEILAILTKVVPHQLLFTLEDQGGKQLWSTPIPVISPAKFSFQYSTDISGTKISVTHQQKDTSDSTQPPFSRAVIVIGSDGRPVSMSDGHKTYNFAVTPTGGSITGPDGKILVQKGKNGIDVSGPEGNAAHLNPDGTGTMQINGTDIAITKVTKDGKTYQSFPWNGHKVLVEQSCTWSVTTDGDLTVNAPSTAKTTASK